MTDIQQNIKTNLQNWFVVDRLLPIVIAVTAALVIGWAVYQFSWILALGLVGAFAFIVVSIHYPILLIITLIMITPFQSNLPSSMNLGGGLNAFNLLMLAIWTIWIVNGINHRNFIWPNHYITYMIVAFSIMVIFSVIRASLTVPEYPVSASIDATKRWLLPMYIFFPLAFSHLRQKDVRLLFWGIAVVVGLMAIASVNDLRQTSLASFSWEGRPGGPFGAGAANDLAAFFVYYPAILLGWFVFEKRIITKTILIGIIAFSLIIIVLTYSRGGYLGILVAVVMIGLFKKRLWLIILMILGVSYKMWMPAGVEQRVEMTAEDHVDDRAEIVIAPNSFERKFEKSTADRLIIWRGAIAMVKEKPFLGFGFNSFQLYVTRYAQIPKSMDTHNMYLRVASELGIIGTLLFLALWLIPFCLAVQFYCHTTEPFHAGIALGVLAAIVGIMVVNLWGSRFFREELVSLYWIVLGLMTRLSYIDHERGII